MEQYAINGGNPLVGEVEIGGVGKNSRSNLRGLERANAVFFAKSNDGRDDNNPFNWRTDQIQAQWD